ncbi:RICIN domain-containing protein [Longispora sp. K20-0274]|uniref:RICIN domain-containing protein n=1 Tax=Longispora sp. K20-0274 TaxID=3088255 RepID=UPI00399AE1EF
MMKALTARILLAAAAIPTILFGAATTANAAPAGYGYNGVVTWQSKQTSNYLDANDYGDCTGSAYTLPYNGGNYQKWQEYYRSSDNTYLLYNMATGLVLDSNWNGDVYVMCSNSGNYQKWKETKTSSGWQLQNVATGMCLGNYGGTLKTWNCDGSTAQRWA